LEDKQEEIVSFAQEKENKEEVKKEETVSDTSKPET
jgi:hypothetical protein